MKRLFALVDCNAFFCSCERLFRPDLLHRPVGVLSNNDGCFVSRTKELKKLQVPMGAPYFKYKEVCEKNEVAVFSSNFSLYTNLSRRVMMVLTRFAPKIEIYSVDEAFLDLTGIAEEKLMELALEMKETIRKEVGIPVSIGISTTKVLSKIANHLAKKSDKAQGIVILSEQKYIDIGLERVAVEDIWGVGRKNSEKFRAMNIKTAKEVRDYQNTGLIQKIFTKVGRQIQDELRGIVCLELADEMPKKKEIMCSRTFGNCVFDLPTLKESVANYATSACEKMRQQDSMCKRVDVFLRTNPFGMGEQYYGYDYYEFITPTLDTRKVIRRAQQVLSRIYRAGFDYKKAGVRLSSLEDKDSYQLGLFYSPDELLAEEKLMQVMDEVNEREGPLTLRPMACGVDSSAWKMKQTSKSPRYLSGWNELPEAKC